MYQYLCRFFRLWEHKVTGAIGLGVNLVPTVDLVSRLLGALAIGVSIYCSISRNQREKRLALLDEENRIRAKRAHLILFPHDDQPA